MRAEFKTAIAAVSLLAMASSAFAAGFAVREQSAEGLGASFAGIAAGSDGLSAMFWNPAAMTLHGGRNAEANLSPILPTSRAKDGGFAPGAPLAGFSDSGNIGEVGLAPAGYASFQVNDALFIGIAVNSPFGLATKSDTWVGSPHGTKSELATYNANPNVALKVNDWLSLAAGVQLEYADAQLTSSNLAGLPIANVKLDSFDAGFTAGILLTPTDSTSIGLGFRSSIKHGLEGDGSVLAYLGDVSGTLKTPETLTFGVRQRIGDRLVGMLGAEWANWSRFKSLTLTAEPSGVPISVTPENWNDSWFVSLGAEYEWSDDLTVRAGAGYEVSSVPDATRTPRMPDNDRIWLSVGASYAVNGWLTAHVGYAHVFMDDGDINLAAAAPLPPLYASFEQSIDIASASATISW